MPTDRPTRTYGFAVVTRGVPVAKLRAGHYVVAAHAVDHVPGRGWYVTAPRRTRPDDVYPTLSAAIDAIAESTQPDTTRKANTMTRRRSTTSTTEPKTDQVDATEPTADQVDADTTEPTEPTEPTADQVDATEPTCDPPEADEVETEHDHVDPPKVDTAQVFRDAFAAAVGERDTSTGTVPLAHVDAVTTAWRALRGADKASLHTQLVSVETAAAIADTPPDLFRVLAANALQSAIAEAAQQKSAPRAAKVTADPVDVALRQVVALDLARANALAILTDDQRTTFDTRHAAIMDGSEPFEADWKVAFGKRGTLSVKRAGGASGPVQRASGPRPIPAHVAEVIASDPSRVWTCTEISKASSSVYPNGGASSGAIANALAHADGPPEGVRVMARDDNGPLRATADQVETADNAA